VVVLGERRICALLLAAVGGLACLMLLFTTSSGAQAQAVARANGAVAAAGEDCVEFADEAGGQTTGSEETVTEQTSEREDEIQSAGNENNAVEQLSQIDSTGETTGNGADINVGTQQENGANGGTQTQDAQSGDIQQSSQVGDESGTGDTTSNDTTSNDTSSEDGTSINAEDNGDPTSDEATSDEATSDDTEDNDGFNNNNNNDGGDAEEEECVIAESVPDELLPPTGVSANSQNGALAQKKENVSNRQNKHSTRDANSSDRNEKASERDGDQKKSSSAKRSSSAEKQRSRIQQQQQQQQKKKNSGASKRKVEIKDRPSGKTVEVEDRSSREPPQEPRQESLGSNSKAATTPDPAPRLAANWSAPSRQEVASAGKLRRFAPNPAGSEMSMSVRALGLYEAPVASSGRPEDLDNGLIRMPQTDLPWDKGDQKNVYVAGHYLGVEGTNSRMIFYNLHKLKKGDEIALKDGLGQVYKYRVSEKFAAGAADNWAMGEVRNRDMLTLQTCIPPDFGKRLLVRADRVEPDDR
jgi:LPXTG-site transpeptidase (sortase) family protein